MPSRLARLGHAVADAALIEDVGGRATSSPSFARSCFTKARTRSVSVGSRASHAWRSSDSDVTTRPASTERMRRISYSVAVSATARPSTVTRRRT